MGIVLRGHDRLNGRQVALKMVRVASACGRLQHPARDRRPRADVAPGNHSARRRTERGTASPGWRWSCCDGRTVCDEIDLLWRKGPEGLFQAQHGRCRSRTCRRCRRISHRADGRRRAGAPAAPPLAAAGRLHDVVEIAAHLCDALDYVHGARAGAPRRQAGERLPRRGRAGDAAGFRPRLPGARHLGQLRGGGFLRGHHGVRRARADAGRAGGCARGHLLARLRALRARDRTASRRREPSHRRRPYRGRSTISLCAMRGRATGGRDPHAPSAVAATPRGETPHPAGPDGLQPASEKPTMTAQTASSDAATITIA